MFYVNLLNTSFEEDQDVKINLKQASDAVKNNAIIIQGLGQ